MPDTTILFTTLRTIVTSEALVAETLGQWLEQLCFLNDSSFMISIFIKPYSKTIYCVDRFPLSWDVVQRLEGCQTRAAADITGFAHISLRLCQSPLSLPSQAPPPPSPGGLICPLLHNTHNTDLLQTLLKVYNVEFCTNLGEYSHQHQSPWGASEQHESRLARPHERTRGERISGEPNKQGATRIIEDYDRMIRIILLTTISCTHLDIVHSFQYRVT